ncbi:hypothetical protein D3C77_498970 [compost metagenome]
MKLTVEFYKKLSSFDKAKLFESRTKRKTSRVRRLIYKHGTLDVSFPVAIKIEGRVFYHPAYQCWANMLRRTYYNKNSVKYNPCIVSDEWHSFSNFHMWWKQNFIEGFELDKDQESILQGLPIATYSPDTCRFIPKWINLLYRKRKDGRLMEIRQAA